jgi:hypothetical protein
MRVPARRRPIAAPNGLACELQILLTLRARRPASARFRGGVRLPSTTVTEK